MRTPSGLALAAGLFVLALGGIVLGYLYLAVPGAWFPSASPRSFPASAMTLARGEGREVGGEWIVTAPDAGGMVILSLNADLRSSDYRAVGWTVDGLPDTVDAQLLWRTDFQPSRLNALPIASAYGQLLPTDVGSSAQWTGRITGIALALRGTFVQPVRVRAAVARPMGVREVIGDRLAEWFEFESWSGSSINALAGGAQVQRLPLPALLAAVVLAASVTWLALAWRRGFAARLPVVLAVLFLAAWALGDARWAVNLARQTDVTARRFAGKEPRDRSLAADDGALYAFVETARARMSDVRARVFVVADSDYVRGRTAYHLYPRNVFFTPTRNEMPPRAGLKPGDYLVVYQRHGVQYSAADRKLCWEGAEPVAAEAVLVAPGAAVFRVE